MTIRIDKTASAIGEGNTEEQTAIRRQQRHTLLILLFIMISVACVFVLNTWSRQVEYSAQQTQLIETSLSSVEGEIGREIDSLRRNVKLTARANLQIIEKIISDPDNDEITDILIKEVKELFPTAYAVSVANEFGEAYYDDFDGMIGELCRRDIKHLAKHGSYPNLVLHPLVDGYHFDIMVPVENPSGKKDVIFFVSFIPSHISRILEQNQLYRHRLVLLNSKREGLIEITSTGSRQGLDENSLFLTAQDSADISHSVTIEGTNWRLVDIPVDGYVHKYQQDLWLELAIQLTLLTVLAFFVYWKLGKSNKQVLFQQLKISEQSYITHMQNIRLERSQKIAQLGYWGYNLADEVTDFSINGRRILGFSQTGTISGMDVIKLITPRDRKRIRFYLASAIIRKKQYQAEFTIVLENGTRHELLASVELTRDNQGNPLYLFGIIQDITDLRHTEKVSSDAQLAHDQAEESNRSKSSFLANMSHEIRTPMNSITGFAETLLDTTLSGQGRDDAVKTIIRNGKHLLKIINDILDLSKIEANKLDSEKIATDIFPIINDIESLIKPQSAEKGLDFRIDYNFPVPARITSDPVRLKQILLNLCSNAVKFTHEGYINLQISYHQDNCEMIFNIIDTGIGMTTDQTDRVFNAFTQADASTSRQYGGTGLGLSLSQNLAIILGGDLTVTSEHNIGSTFSLRISSGPVDSNTLVHDHHSIPEIRDVVPFIIPTTKWSGEILLAEDVPDNQKLLSLYIKKTGASLTIVENGKLALIAAMKKDYDLVLMDMHMPVMDGMKAVRLLRERGYKKTIVALTANAMSSDKQYCIDAGCDDYVTKPIDHENFYRIIQKYLKPADEKSNDITPITSSLTDADDPEYSQLIDSYVKQLPDVYTRLKAHLNESDWEKAREEAHNIKGSGGHFGYIMLTDIAAEMETHIRGNNHSELTTLIEEFESLSQRIYRGRGFETEVG